MRHWSWNRISRTLHIHLLRGAALTSCCLTCFRGRVSWPYPLPLGQPVEWLSYYLLSSLPLSHPGKVKSCSLASIGLWHGWKASSGDSHCHCLAAPRVHRPPTGSSSGDLSLGSQSCTACVPVFGAYHMTRSVIHYYRGQGSVE